MANAEYPIDIIKSGKVKLLNGHFEEQASPGSATITTVSLLSKSAWGDLNNDREKDAAVILVVDGGGSGTFYYLAAVLNKKEGIAPVDSKFLGDRIEINTIQIEDGKIIVEFLQRADDEPMSSTPATETISTFILKNNTLHQIRK